jgi:hypothetical protein
MIIRVAPVKLRGVVVGLKELERPFFGEAAYVAAMHRRGFHPMEYLVGPDQTSPVGSARSDCFAWDMEEPCIVKELAKLDDPSNVQKRTARKRIVMRPESAVGASLQEQIDLDQTRP